MTKEKVQQILSVRNNNFYNVVGIITDYVNVYENKINIVNNIVTSCKGNRNLTSIDIFKYFFENLKHLVEGSVYCPSTYNAQMLLKNVWEKSLLQLLVIQQIRKGYEIIPLPNAHIPANETSKEEKLRVQAERMRAAKAKKAAEKKAIEDANAQNIKQAQAKKEAFKNMTKEQKEQIELLRNLKI
jgi:hypothetical protein